MSLSELLNHLAEKPLVASVQTSAGSYLGLDALEEAAKTSLAMGAGALRAQGVEAVARFSAHTPWVIGLIKRDYPGSPVYITPTLREVQELAATPCRIIALDATRRPRPGGEELRHLVEAIHAAGRLAMADCDSMDSMRHAVESGVDILSTTLSGYTDGSPAQPGPDLELVRQAAAQGWPVLAEGRYAEPSQAACAMAAGAVGVVIGGALNDPAKQTRRFAQAIRPAPELVAGADIGGTWIRFGLWSAEQGLHQVVREPLPRERGARLAWLRARLDDAGLPPTALGVSTGGVVEPATATIIRAKSLIPDYEGTQFAWPDGQARALNDGLATVWGHAVLPQHAGRRIAVLALGTGVGFGFVESGRLFMGPQGDPPHLNDTAFDQSRTIEDVLGGLSLSQGRDPEARELARASARQAIHTVRRIFLPDEVIVCGGVGLADWMAPVLEQEGALTSPFGADAGLMGAMALARAWPFDSA
jgi:putative N-acetylmannosamine-6-phosphate epimerase/predicted NBD/HSP70 family sugar kinase